MSHRGIEEGINIERPLSNAPYLLYVRNLCLVPLAMCSGGGAVSQPPLGGGQAEHDDGQESRALSNTCSRVCILFASCFVFFCIVFLDRGSSQLQPCVFSIALDY